MESCEVNLNKFITKDMFLDLAGCVAIVTSCVELSKLFTDFNPLWLNLIFSFFVTSVRIVFDGDFSLQGVILGIFNLIPILLGATGLYEVLKHTIVV